MCHYWRPGVYFFSHILNAVLLLETCAIIREHTVLATAVVRFGTVAIATQKSNERGLNCILSTLRGLF